MNTGNDVIISAALTGAVTPKEINEHIPLTPEEIAADAYRCWRQGAAIVHLHMRDDQGQGTMDCDKFAETIRLLRGYRDCDVIINCTTSGDHRASDAQRMEHVSRLEGIEIASWDAGSFNWMPGGVFINSPQFLGKLGEILSERGSSRKWRSSTAACWVSPAILSNRANYALRCTINSVSACRGMPATVENLNYLVAHIPADATWSAFGVGKHHLPILFATLALGGHVRVGLEDNVYFSKG